MNWKLLNPSRFIQAAVLNGKAGMFTIAGVGRENMEGDEKKPARGKPAPVKMKGVITLEEKNPDTGEPWVWAMNVANATALKEMFGEETDAWVGKHVLLGPQKVMAFGEMVDGIRVRGSPDIEADITYTLKLRKKQEQRITLKKIGGWRPAAPASTPAPEAPTTHPAEDPPMEAIMAGYPGIE